MPSYPLQALRVDRCLQSLSLPTIFGCKQTCFFLAFPSVGIIIHSAETAPPTLHVLLIFLAWYHFLSFCLCLCRFIPLLLVGLGEGPEVIGHNLPRLPTFLTSAQRVKKDTISLVLMLVGTFMYNSVFQWGNGCLELWLAPSNQYVTSQPDND